MKLLKAIGSTTWYMTKSGLLYGALLGGLFGVAIAILSSIGSPYFDDASDVINYCALAGGFGAVIGSILGLVMGVVDGPILVLLMHIFNQTDAPSRRRIQTANAILVTIGVLLILALVMGVDAIIGVESRHPLVFYSTIAVIAGGAFGYATGNFAERQNQHSSFRR